MPLCSIAVPRCFEQFFASAAAGAQPNTSIASGLGSGWDKDSRSVTDIMAVNPKTDLLSIPPGSVLQIQSASPENAPRHSVRLIGYLPGGSLVTTAPTHNGRVSILREGQRFNIRVLKGERVLGFKARVLDTAMRPYPHLHFEYPEEVEQILIRNGSRVSADIDVSVRNTKDENIDQNFRPGTIVDLSETGAKIATDVEVAEDGERLHMKFHLLISGGKEELGLLADVRNATERMEENEGIEHSVFYTGVQFRALSRFQQILLHAWVTNQVLKDALWGQRD